MADDTRAAAALAKVARFRVTAEVRGAYDVLIGEYRSTTKNGMHALQLAELKLIANQEQINILQPLIYDDRRLAKTLDINHEISRRFGEFFSPRYAVIFSAKPKVDDPALTSVFDDSDGLFDRLSGAKRRLADEPDRMKYVLQIAAKFESLMRDKTDYMVSQLEVIRTWKND